MSKRFNKLSHTIYECKYHMAPGGPWGNFVSLLVMPLREQIIDIAKTGISDN